MPVVPLHVVLLDRSLDLADSMWGDGVGGWLPPGPAWLSILAGTGVPYSVARDTSEIGVAGVLVVAEPSTWDGAGGDNCAVITGRPPDGGVSAALAELAQAMGAVVRPDFRGVLLPRLDDPGSATRRHLDGWRHDDVSEHTWDALWRALDGFGAMSVFCCPGWVEADGRVVPSRQASPGEWYWIDEGCRRGVAELECHGYTHIHPDTMRWAAAPDRHSNEAWYRELRPPIDDREPSVSDQEETLKAWQDACGPGTALVAPGEAWGLNTVRAARHRGFQLMNSWGLCRLQLQVPTWTDVVVSPYLDQPEASGLAEGLPVIGYWHDRDLAVHGPAWAPDWISVWRDVGVTRAWSFARLARAYSAPIEAALVDGDVVVRSGPIDGVVIERARA